MNNLLLLNLLENIVVPLIILIASAYLYFKIATHFKIIDKPNFRSSHSFATIRGGGIIFLVALILFFFRNHFSYPYLFVAILLSGTISFIDDVVILKNTHKAGVHLISVLLIFRQCNLFNELSPLILVIAVIVFIGIINAYNFMDGINGLTGLYSLAIIIPLLLTEQDIKIQSLQLFLLMGLLVFNFFNVRKKAKCFAGDVGSISMALLIVFLLLTRIRQSNSFIYAGMLLVYGIDTVYTIIQRLIQKENIFKPHRKHLYQYYCNLKKIPHIRVSLIYATLQLIINLAIVFGYLSYGSLIFLMVLLSAIYWILKMPFIKMKDINN